MVAALSVVLCAALRPAQADAPLLKREFQTDGFTVNDLPDASSHLGPLLSAPASGTFTITTDDGLALALSADGQITGLQIDGNDLVTTPTPALQLRDLSNAGTVITPNLVSNPGFEAGLVGWSELFNNGLTVTVVFSPTHNGSSALAFSYPLTDTPRFAAYASDPVTVTPGQRYRVSAWFRSNTGYVNRPSGVPPLLQLDL
ncbi:MAG TPA: hypothetical protein EYP04_05935 [Anaerolineae bacterium]|nr:hypothetical protein [Anaerolineae bacterium]HIQ04097.1 hypothetical protein [Anaerolineae bacterium]